MELAADWTKFERARWVDLRPQCAGDRLLLLDPSVSEARHYRELGWVVDVVFMDTPWRELEGFRVLHGSWDDLALEDSLPYDAVASHWVLGFAPRPEALCCLLKKYCRPGGRLVLYAQNALSQVVLLEKATRDIRPWPEHIHRGRLWTRTRLEALGATLGCRFSLEEDLDPLAMQPGFDKWQLVTGFDCRLALPGDLSERRLHFVHGWWLMAQPEPVVGALDGDLQQVEKALESGDLVAAAQKLDALQRRGSADYRISNLLGVLAFYQGDPARAYACFLDALTLDATHEDVWSNAIDAAHHIGRTDDLKWLLQQRKASLPIADKLLSTLH